MMTSGARFTVTVKVQVAEFPHASATILVTVVLPTGKAKPLGGTLTIVLTAQLSVAVTLNITLLQHTPGPTLTVTSLGQLICGGVLSWTVIVCAQLALLLTR